MRHKLWHAGTHDCRYLPESAGKERDEWQPAITLIAAVPDWSGMDIDVDRSPPVLLGLAGAAVTVVAAFLPWVTTSAPAGPVEAGGTAMGIEGVGLATLLLGLVVGGVLVLLDWDATTLVVTAVVGLLVAGVAGWKLLSLDGVASPGVGLYLTVLAGLVVLASGLWGWFGEGSDDHGAL